MLTTRRCMETKTVFAQKFAGMLGGGAIESLAALVREHPQFYCDFKREDANLELLPSYLDTLRLLKKAAPGRGLGPDAIGGELLKSGAVQICRVIYSVLVKTVTQISLHCNGRAGSCLNCSRKVTTSSLTAIAGSRVSVRLPNSSRDHYGGLNGGGGGCDFTRFASLWPWKQPICPSCRVVPSLLT